MGQQTNTGKTKENTLIFPVEKLILSVRKNEIYDGNLTFLVEPECEISSFFYATNYRLKVNEDEVKGKELTFSYSFDATGLEEGEIISGSIYLITNIGEYFLPFEITILNQVLTCSEGEIRNLFHFVNLARSNWPEAVALFYHPRFVHLFEGHDRQYLGLYKGLSRYQGNERNVEEFLLGIRKKNPIEYELETEPLQAQFPVQSRYQIDILKKGWGYSEIRVTSDADFIMLDDANESTSFENNKLTLYFQIDKEKLHAGNNYGEICIFINEEKIMYPVLVNKGGHVHSGGSSRKKVRLLTSNMLRNYIRFAIGKYDKESFLNELEDTIEQVNQQNGRNLMARLFQAQLLNVRNRENEAKWVLKHVDDLLENQGAQLEYTMFGASEVDFYAYYAYLNYRLHFETADYSKTQKTLWDLYKDNEAHVFVLRALMSFDNSLRENQLESLRMCQVAYEKGCRSPLLYEAVYKIYKDNASFITELDDLTVQTLFFIEKHHLFTSEIIGRLNQLAGRKKELSEAVFRLLKDCFMIDDSNDSLQTICTYLIKKSCVDKKAFAWYEKAVERDIRITKLYEYYIMSWNADGDTEIPQQVLMYFSYECNLDYKHTAYLYAYVLHRKDEMPQIYESYQAHMKLFVRKQVLLGHINEDLAKLYTEFLEEDMLQDSEFVNAFLHLLFIRKIKVNNASANYVLVAQRHFTGYKKYPIHEGCVYAPIHDDEFMIFLEWEDGRIGALPGLYEEKALFDKTMFLPENFLNASLEDGVAFYFSQSRIGIEHLSATDLSILERAYQDKQLVEEYREELALLLIRHYYDYDQMQQLDALLRDISLKNKSKNATAQIIRMLVVREQYEKAYAATMKYGFESLASKTLLRLFYYGQENKTEKSELLALANFIFEKGKADDAVMEYLLEYFEGSTKRMREIWERAKDLELETRTLAEKIIAQTIHCNAYVAHRQDIFNDYYRQEPNPYLVEKYLLQCANQYFLKEQILDANVFAIMMEQEKLPNICKVATVCFFSRENKGMTRREKELVHTYITELLEENIYFPFFNVFGDDVATLLPMCERTFLEYRSKTDNRVFLHYRPADAQVGDEYCTEELNCTFEGYYFRSFLMFYGEKMQYYISEKSDTDEIVTMSGVLEKNDTVDFESNSRYGLLNQMLMSQSLGEPETVKSLANDYERALYLTEKLFEIR